MSRPLLLSLLFGHADGHFMWMRHAQPDKAPAPATCIVTFAEGAGSAEPLPLLQMVANKTSVLTIEHGVHPVRLNLSVTILGEEGAALEAPIQAKPPYMMRLTTNYGVFGPNKMQLVYTATAPSVSRPYDWQSIDAQAGSHCGLGAPHLPHQGEGCGLEITLRDPYMIGASPGEGVPARSKCRLGGATAHCLGLLGRTRPAPPPPPRHQWRRMVLRSGSLCQRRPMSPPLTIQGCSCRPSQRRPRPPTSARWARRGARATPAYATGLERQASKTGSQASGLLLTRWRPPPRAGGRRGQVQRHAAHHAAQHHDVREHRRRGWHAAAPRTDGGRPDCAAPAAGGPLRPWRLLLRQGELHPLRRPRCDRPLGNDQHVAAAALHRAVAKPIAAAAAAPAAAPPAAAPAAQPAPVAAVASTGTAGTAPAALP